MIILVVAACWLQLMLLLVVPTRSFTPRLAPTTRKGIQTPSQSSCPQWRLRGSSSPSSTPTEALSPPETDDDDDTLGDEKEVKNLLSNILSVCLELQDSQQFSPPWLDAVEIVGEANKKKKLVTTREIDTGDIINLLPIDDLSLSFDDDENDTSSDSKEKQIVMPLLVYHNDEPEQYEITTNIHPLKDNSRRAPGWLGHLATIPDDEDSNNNNNVGSNCVVLPVMGASPLCALVAAQSIPAGTELMVYDRPIDNPDFYNYVISKQFADIQALAAIISRAYHDTLFQPGILLDDGTSTDDETTSPPTTTSSNPTNFQYPFYSINTEYPGLRYLHHDPDILVVDNFLTEKECDSIIQQSEDQLKPCVTRHPVTGEIRQDPRRTSTNAELRQEDAPNIVEKLVHLTKAQHSSYFEKFQVLKYEAGQAFVPHTDGFPGKTTAGGFEDSGRLVTIFCYLKDVPEGGETRFTKLLSSDDKQQVGGETVVSIAPRKGMAVIHFPATLGLEEDLRTEHEGCPAVDEKWLLVTWLWKDRRKDLPPSPNDS